MKKTILTVILTIVAIAAILFISNAIWGDGECIFSDNDDNTECSSVEKKACNDKEYDKKSCCDKDSHHMMMAQLIPFRAELENQLSDEEKASIEAIQDKFEDAEDDGHEKLCAEGMAKFQEAHKDDIAALLAIANNHQQFFDDMIKKMHDEEMCEHAKVADGEVKKDAGCPEAAKCKEATEKCKGKAEKTVESKAECKEAMAECKKSCEDHMDTFKVHFLLLDDDMENDN